MDAHNQAVAFYGGIPQQMVFAVSLAAGSTQKVHDKSLALLQDR